MRIRSSSVNWAASYPAIDRGEGIHLYDTAGKRYIDGAGGVFVTNLGHGNQHVVEALVAQARA